MTNEWIEHDGKEMPVSGDQEVFIRVRWENGAETTEASLAKEWIWPWEQVPFEDQILAYRPLFSQALTPSKEKVETAS